ncbi:MAG: mechanosensitive ion channel [Proteobacteria bacterium]|nr:mechanosensitive ion channel [Pseudomonadota bacterium]
MTPLTSGLPADFMDVLGLAAVLVFFITSVSALITSAIISRNGFLHLGVQLMLLLLSLHLTYHWSWALWFSGIFASQADYAHATLAGAMLAGAVAIDTGLRYFVWHGALSRDGQMVVPKLLVGVVRVLVYLLDILIILQFVYDQSITALATLSGAFALVIGLSAQSTLGEMFAGIAIALSHPFRIGDWVKIGNLDEGRVIDMTWRLVRIESRDKMVLNVTNRIVADSAIRNFSYPNRTVRLSELIYFDQLEDPQEIQELLIAALGKVRGVLADPKPYVLYRGARDGVAEYNLRYYIDDYGAKDSVTERVWKRVMEQLRQAGRGVALPRRRIELAAEAIVADQLRATAAC